MDYRPWGRQELDTTKWLSLHFNYLSKYSPTPVPPISVNFNYIPSKALEKIPGIASIVTCIKPENPVTCTFRYVQHWPLLRSPLCVCSAKSCLTLCDPMDCSPPDSSVQGTSQARELEEVAISFSGESSRPRNRTCVSYISYIGRWFLCVCVFF